MDKDNNIILHQCKYCQLMIRSKSIMKHIYKKHLSESAESIQRFIDSIPELANKNSWNSYLKIRENQVNNEKIKGQYKCNMIFINGLLDEVESAKYFEEKKIQLEKLKKLLSSNTLGLEFYDKKYIRDKIQDFERLKVRRDQFIKDSCNVKYFTWDDVKFNKDNIEILNNGVLVSSIKIKGALKVLNELKPSYFKRLHGKAAYKLVFHNGSVLEDCSTGLKRVLEIIKEHIESSQFKGIEKVKLAHREIEYNFSNIDTIVNQIKEKNKFIYEAASLMNSEDKAIGILENMNGLLEECLLFKYFRNSSVFFLWENINPNRAAYVFQINVDLYEDANMKLKEMITSRIQYKRETLFRGCNLEKLFGIKSATYYMLVHDFPFLYKRKLREILI